jgi:hypothetical protein
MPKLANSQPAKTSGFGLFRGTILVLAFVLACQAFWILAAEFYRPSAIGFPTNFQVSPTAVAKRDAAHLAALFGLIRGDLWAQDALAYPDIFWPNERNNTPAQRPAVVEQAHNATLWALADAPHDARTWLVLASIDSRFDWLNGKASAALRMSYYTGANEVTLIPLRLLLAVGFSSISDTDFQQLVRHDILIVVTRKPEFKSSLLDAYRYALPAGQNFIEQTLKELDPKLLSTLQSK